MKPPNVVKVSQFKREFNNYENFNESGLAPNVYLFVYFYEPAIVVIEGIEHLVEKNACIIYSPGVRQEYRNYNGVFINSFLALHSEDPFLFSKHELPENEIFYIASGDEVNLQLEYIAYLAADKLVDRSDEIQKHLDIFFEALSGSVIENKPKQKRKQEIKQRFLNLRDEIYRSPKGWTVEKMAKHVWFTRSRFSVLYNELMHISPSEDLTRIRMTYAKNLLKTTDMPISGISVESGYTSSEHFIRVFSKNAGCTPLQYRKNKKQEL